MQKESKNTTYNHNIPNVKLFLVPNKASPGIFSATEDQIGRIPHKANGIHLKQITVCLEINEIANFVTLKLPEGSTCAQLLCKVYYIQ